jgi:hypothetical protein
MPIPGAGETLPRSLRGSSAIAVSLIVGFALVVPGAGASSRQRLADTPPFGGGAAPSVKRDSVPPTCRTRASDPALTFKQPFAGGPSPTGDACGTLHDDSIKVSDSGGAGTHIWAGPGRDVVNAQNKKIDEIWGGRGDKATIDWCLPDGKIYDHANGIANPTKVKVNCVGVTRSSKLLSRSAITYPYDEPYISCTVGTSGRRLMSISRDPFVQAIDATPNVDWQTVAFSALLYKWNGSDYVFSEQSAWVWDRAADEQLTDFSGNFWRRFGETTHRKIFFNPPTEGRYRIAIRYHWYAANGIDEHDELDWASYHFGHFGSASLGHCDFPGPPPPDGHYAGTTDEGKAVSFDAGPIWTTVPRDVAGSKLTNVKIANTINCTPARTLSFAVNVDPGRWIQVAADNTFAYARSGGLTSTTRQNETATYSITGKIEPAGTATGSVHISQVSFDDNGTRYNCTGAPHGWTAAKSG